VNICKKSSVRDERREVGAMVALAVPVVLRWMARETGTASRSGVSPVASPAVSSRSCQGF
jgi:hypothetical protein